jgi:predicted translin family RNA/ssDNA-binding protein
MTNIFKLILPSLNKDRADGPINLYENEILTNQFNDRVQEIKKQNLAETLKLLRAFATYREAKFSGLLLTEEQQKQEATRLFFELQNQNQIDEFENLKPALLETIKDKIK